jgi:hypothetical protein
MLTLEVARTLRVEYLHVKLRTSPKIRHEILDDATALVWDCRHSSQYEDGGDEVEGGSEACVGLVVACSDATELLEALEAIVDEMAPLVHIGIVWDHRQDRRDLPTRQARRIASTQHGAASTDHGRRAHAERASAVPGLDP